MQHQNQPHFSADAPATPCAGPTVTFSSAADHKRGKKRGSYNCGRCGLPKKGHNCHTSITTTTTTDTTTATTTSSPIINTPTSRADSSASLSSTRPPPPRQPYTHFRRALSFDDDVRAGFPEPEPEVEEEEQEEEDFGYPSMDPEPGALPASCLWEILRRLPPAGLLSAARVSKSWRETSKRLWKAAEELRLRVPARAQVGFVGSVLQKCPGLVRLSLRMERLGFLIWNSVRSMVLSDRSDCSNGHQA